MSSRRENIPCRPGFAVVVGWDNPLMTFFAQVRRTRGDKLVLWIGTSTGEFLKAEDLVVPLAPYTDLDAPLLAQLRADRAADADRGPTQLQRQLRRLTGDKS